MFYDNNIMNDKLVVVWCYAHHQKVSSDNIGIPKICSTLHKWVDNDGTKRRRMSLRTSALLVNGTARLYKDELDKLYQDCIQLDSSMIYRRNNDMTLTDDACSDSVTEEDIPRNSCDQSQSNMNRQASGGNNSEFSLNRGKLTRRGSRNIEIRPTSSDQSDHLNRTFTINKRDAEVQTSNSYIASQKEGHRCRRKEAFDVNGPMGVIMVYDESSRVPTKVICANINKNFK